jgi:hypothetical protein
MKLRIREIYLSWRKGPGHRRKLVGVLKRTSTDGITFKYLKEGVEEAQKEGFSSYPGFPVVYDKTYSEKDLDIFSLRLIPLDRKDNAKSLSFWEATDVKDKFDLLALTQGILPTDNFELLGLFNPSKQFRFVSDLAGLTHLQLEKGTVREGDQLTYQTKRNVNAFRDTAVAVYKGEKLIGYIKNIHNNIFLSTSHKLKLTVKSVDQNGHIRKIFVLIDS